MRIEELSYVSIIFQKPSKSEHYRTSFAIGYFKFYLEGRSKLVSLFKGVGSYNYPKFYTMITLHTTFFTLFDHNTYPNNKLFVCEK